MAIMAATAAANENTVYAVFARCGAAEVPRHRLGFGLFALGNGANAGGSLHPGRGCFWLPQIKQSQVGRDGWGGSARRSMPSWASSRQEHPNATEENAPRVKDSRSTRGKSDEDFNRRGAALRMDAILDKVSKHGYENLT